MLWWYFWMHFVQAHAWFVITGTEVHSEKPSTRHGQHRGAHTHQLGLLLCLLHCFLCFLLLFLQGFLRLGLLLLLSGAKAGRQHTTQTAQTSIHLSFREAFLKDGEKHSSLGLHTSAQHPAGFYVAASFIYCFNMPKNTTEAKWDFDQ